MEVPALKRGRRLGKRRAASQEGAVRVQQLVPQVTKQPRKQTSQQPLSSTGFRKKRFFCKPCRRSYLGPCNRHSGLCYLCRSPDHWVADCPFNQDRPPGNSDFRGISQVNPPVEGGMVGRGEENPRRGQGSNQGRQQHGGQTRQDTALVHATVGQEHPATRTCCQCVCHLDSSGQFYVSRSKRLNRMGSFGPS